MDWIHFCKVNGMDFYLYIEQRKGEIIMNYNVYKHTNLINNKTYIGITSQKCENRWGVNGKGYELQPKFYHAIQKYGWNNFQHEILYVNLSKEEVLQIEADLIQKYNSIENGYNVSPHGNIESKRIICLTTQEIFDSITDAAVYGGVSDSNLSHYLKGEWDTCGELNGIKLTWEFLDYPDKNIKAQQLREQRKQHREEKFYSIEALEIVELYKKGISIRQLAKDYHKSRESIKTILHFYDIPIISSSEKRRRGVVQLDSNKQIINQFNTMADALRSMGMNPNNTSRLKLACEEQWRKVGGYYWRWAED